MLPRGLSPLPGSLHLLQRLSCYFIRDARAFDFFTLHGLCFRRFDFFILVVLADFPLSLNDFVFICRLAGMVGAPLLPAAPFFNCAFISILERQAGGDRLHFGVGSHSYVFLPFTGCFGRSNDVY